MGGGARLQHRLAEQPGSDAQDQPDPQRLPQDRDKCGHSCGCSAARASIAIGEDKGKIAAARPIGESGAPIARGEAEDRAPGQRSPASTWSALRARSRPARRWSGRPRRAADSSSRNRRWPARGTPASRPPAAAASDPALLDELDDERTGPIHTTIPSTEAASIANSLPTNIASIGIAAAMISMILFDFSSISWDSTMPARGW